MIATRYIYIYIYTHIYIYILERDIAVIAIATFYRFNNYDIINMCIHIYIERER